MVVRIDGDETNELIRPKFLLLLFFFTNQRISSLICDGNRNTTLIQMYGLT